MKMMTIKSSLIFGITLFMIRGTCMMPSDIKTAVENQEKCQKQNDEVACTYTNSKLVSKTDLQVVVQGAHGDKVKSASYAKQRTQLELPGSVVAGREECIQQNAPSGYTGPEKVFWLCTVTAKKK